jgi:hypothetical protein
LKRRIVPEETHGYVLFSLAKFARKTRTQAEVDKVYTGGDTLGRKNYEAPQRLHLGCLLLDSGFLPQREINFHPVRMDYSLV